MTIPRRSIVTNLIATIFLFALFFVLPTFLLGHVKKAHAAPTDDFVTTWKTDNPSSSDGPDTITIPTNGGGYNYNVDWGDGNSDSGATGNISHTYAVPGTYTVRISGTFPSIYFNYSSVSRQKIISIEQWGTQVWGNQANAFMGTDNLVDNSTDVPNFSAVTDMFGMFYSSTFNGDVSAWDMSHVVNMTGMFDFDTLFNGDVTGWNTSNVTDMTGVFEGATSFNQDLSNWDTGKVTSFLGMFANATSFDQDLSSWDVKGLTDARFMFDNVGLSTANYDALLTSWGSQILHNNVTLDAGTSVYCTGNTGRSRMVTTYHWTINDGGSTACAPPVDSTPPATPGSAPDLQTASDTGVSTTDNLTDDTTPTFDVDCTESGATIKLYFDATVNGTLVCAGTGTQAVTTATSLTDAVYSVTYTATDTSLNESGHSPVLSVTIDTTVPGSTPSGGHTIQSGSSATGGSTPLYRLWNLKLTDHFYTTNIAERDLAISNGYVFEGTSGLIAKTIAIGYNALYRLWNGKTLDHFYTTDLTEKNLAVKNGYKDEGIIGYVAIPNSLGFHKLYRFYSAQLSDHFYTSDDAEAQSVINNNSYKLEAIVGGIK